MKYLIAIIGQPLVQIAIVLAAVWTGIYYTGFKPQELEQWTPDLAEAQYQGSKYGRWGERIISLEGSPCEIHRVRYRYVYYIANTCGGLIIEPTRRS